MVPCTCRTSLSGRCPRQRFLPYTVPVIRELFSGRDDRIGKKLKHVLLRNADLRLTRRGSGPGGKASPPGARSSRSPLNTASRSKPSSVSAPYSTSASSVGSTQVAFGYLIRSLSGDVRRINGSGRSRSSRAVVSVYPIRTLPT